MFSRTICAARISLSIGLVGVLLSFAIGLTLGGISGFFGGGIDTFIQRVIEFIISIPTIPLWMALAAALPREWSVLQVYFGIVVILSLVRWGSLARVVRGKLLELREHDFTMAGAHRGHARGNDHRPPHAAVVRQLPDRAPDPGDFRRSCSPRPR